MAGSSHHDITHFQRSVADEYGRHISTALVERRLDDRTRCLAVRIGLEVEHLGFEEHLLQQVVNTNTLLGGNLLALILATPLLDEQVHLGEVFTYLVGIGSRLVNLVDGEHHRHVGSLGMGDGLLGGGHHAVVGGDDDDGDIGHLGTTGTHGRKSLVARRIEEGDASSVLEFHIVGTDVLGNTTRLTGDDIGVADMVEQRGLAMVHMTHHRNDGCSGHEVVLIVLLFLYSLAHLGTHIFSLEAELFCHEIDGLGIEALVDRHHNAH